MGSRGIAPPFLNSVLAEDDWSASSPLYPLGSQKMVLFNAENFFVQIINHETGYSQELNNSLRA
jgi:hypothetical protein